MELLEGIETRRSCRAFTSVPVSKETIDRILKTASRSPSYTNTQPWEVAVVSGKKGDELSSILYKLAESNVHSNPDFPAPKAWPAELEKRAKEHGARRYQVLEIAREDAQKRREVSLQNFNFYGAPCVFFLFLDSTLSSWSVFDMGLFTQSLILSAHSFGVESCIQAMLGNYPDAVREFLGIPKTKLLVLGISMGYPDKEAPINTYHSLRIGLEDFVKWYR